MFSFFFKPFKENFTASPQNLISFQCFFFFPNMNANICLAFLLHLKSLFSLKLDQCKGKSNFKRLTCRNHIFNIFLMQYSIQYIYFFLMLFDTKKLMCKLSVINFICILLPSFRKDEILYEK